MGWKGFSYGGSSRLDGGWKDDHVLLLHFFGKSLLGYFLARASFFGGSSQLRFVGDVKDSLVKSVGLSSNGPSQFYGGFKVDYLLVFSIAMLLWQAAFRSFSSNRGLLHW